MSDNSRRDRGALAALALIIGAVLLVAFLDVSSKAARPDDLDRTSDGGPWPRFTPTDTYAQWLMAMLAGVGTIVSIVGIVWIKQTLEATRATAAAAKDANDTARLAIEVDQRPWLVIETKAVRGSIADNRLYADIEIVAKNVGRTPALGTSFNALSWPIGGAVDIERWHSEFISATTASAGTGAIFQSIVTPDAPFRLRHSFVIPLSEVTIMDQGEDKDAPRYLVMVACGVAYRTALSGSQRYSMRFSVLTLVDAPIDPTGNGGTSVHLAALSGGDLMT